MIGTQHFRTYLIVPAIRTRPYLFPSLVQLVRPAHIVAAQITNCFWGRVVEANNKKGFIDYRKAQGVVAIVGIRGLECVSKGSPNFPVFSGKDADR